jgi:bacterioferritin-associated ferredoxin
MFVCLCNAVTDAMIEEEVRHGNNTLEQLVDTLKVATICGTCKNEIENVILRVTRAY